MSSGVSETMTVTCWLSLRSSGSDGRSTPFSYTADSVFVMVPSYLGTIRAAPWAAGPKSWKFRFLHTKPTLWEPGDLLRIRSAALASNRRGGAHAYQRHAAHA